MALRGKICLVTGASRGIGKGIALQLGQAGATVYITGRASSPRSADVGGSLKATAEEINARGGNSIPVVCDHSNDEDVRSLFERISSEQGRLDVLVNNVFAAAQTTLENVGKDLGAKNRFWEYDRPPGEYWDAVNRVGLRNHYICSSYAARLMTQVKNGLIINVSSFGGIRYAFSVPYSVGKCAVDRMIADMAHELKSSNVACISLYPGPVKTEEMNLIVSKPNENEQVKRVVIVNAETPEFSGKAVVSLASDSNIMRKTGKICIVAELAREYGFTDVDGNIPSSSRQLNTMLNYYGYHWLAAFIPNSVKIPGFLLIGSQSMI